jgi:hypothetical protein
VAAVVIEQGMQALDHPVLLTHPESWYLKSLYLRRCRQTEPTGKHDGHLGRRGARHQQAFVRRSLPRLARGLAARRLAVDFFFADLRFVLRLAF